MKHRQSKLTALAAFAVVLVLAGCGKPEQAAASAAPQALPVSVMTVKTESVQLTRELPGRASALRVAEVRARINGIVVKRLFTEGADVKEGDVLFEIDPAPYQAALDSARASLARAEAAVASASAQADRFKGLVATNAISRQDYDDAFARQGAAAADVAFAKAAVQAAEINLGYTRVTSPISGRIGQARVTEGAYVQAASATLLATVQQLDPLYIDLQQSADEVFRLKKALASGRLQRNGDAAVKLEIILDQGELYPHAGSLAFSDVSVDRSTGSITLRGTVPNPQLELLPGMFVRARLEEGVNANAILVPQSLVSRNSKGEPTTLVVGAENKVELRILGISRSVGNRWLVIDGLAPGDRVITNNLQKLRPGAPVAPSSGEVAAAPKA